MEVTTPPEKITRSITFTAPASLIQAFALKAAEVHGERGQSKAGREAMVAWLAQHGVAYVEESAARFAGWVKKLEALAELGVPVDDVLTRALQEAGPAKEAAERPAA